MPDDDTYFVVRYSPAQIRCDSCGEPMPNTGRGGCGPYIVVGHPDAIEGRRGRACSNECVPAILERPVPVRAKPPIRVGLTVCPVPTMGE